MSMRSSSAAELHQAIGENELIEMTSFLKQKRAFVISISQSMHSLFTVRRSVVQYDLKLIYISDISSDDREGDNLIGERVGSLDLPANFSKLLPH